MGKRCWAVAFTALSTACDRTAVPPPPRPTPSAVPAPTPSPPSPRDPSPEVAREAHLEVRVRDAGTGAPIEVCDLVGSKTADGLTMYTPSRANVAADGVHRYRVSPMVGRLRFDAPGYSRAWTPPLRIDAGVPKTMSLELQPLGRLVVTVVEADGRPLKEGTLFVVGRELETTMAVKDGVADAPLDAGELLVTVDPDLMPGFVPTEQVVVIRPGQQTSAHLEVERR